MRHVEPGEVEQLERPHAEAGAVPQDAVDLVELGDAFAKRLQRLGAEAAAGVVDDEARRVLRPHRRVAASGRASAVSASPTHGAVITPSITSTTFISGTGLKK